MSELKFVLVTLFMLIVTTVQQQCPGVSNYQKKKDSKTRLTSIIAGNYTVQALVTFSNGKNCDHVDKNGLVKSYAIKYAIDKANSNNSLTRYAKLGLQLDDVCRSLPVTMARGIEVVSLHRPNSVCRADFLKCDSSSGINVVDVKQASAVIGTGMSFTTIPLASLMSLYYIPQLSYSASSRLLSKKDLYKSFFRTIPSDTNQISVMLDIFKTFNWNYVFAIGSDDDYGKLGVSDLKREANQRNVCIAHDEYIPYQSTRTKQRVTEVVQKIKKAPKAIVVVLFCYVKELGDYILEEAEKQGINRIWLTSEAWNPAATTLSLRTKNQTAGILSVSLKRYRMKHFLDYMEKEIQTDFNCNMWLQRYLEYTYSCKINGISGDNTTLTGKKVKNPATDCFVKISRIMDKLSDLPGQTDSLIDAVTAVSHGISRFLEKKCSDQSCNILRLTMREVTDEMFNVSFTNGQGQHISFNKLGDPQYAYYTIENLHLNGTKYQFIPVGSWSQKRGAGNELVLNHTEIRWPEWFYKNQPVPSFPDSRCSKECEPGSHVVGRTGCCWGCQKCTDNTHTSKKMMVKCVDCGNYHHTLDHKKCIQTPLLWLVIKDAAGMSIIIISTLGLCVMAMAIAVLLKFRHLITPNEPAPHLITLSCLLVFVTFAYGPLHITEPTHLLCQTRNSIFFMLLMTYSSILLIKSKFMTKYLHKHAEKSFRGNLLSAQLLFLFMLFLLELVSVVAWLYIDKVQVQEFRQPTLHAIWLQCEVTFTAARLVSTFIPCIVLIIATFCAFRERNLEHSFYEPKFLSFTCIALCIIIVAFLPTFNYVVGIYKAIVMAFTMDVFAYTFMACLVLPKVYVAIMRNKRGISEYPVKPGTATKQKEKEVVQEHSVPGMEPTESSMVETSVAKTLTSSRISSDGDKTDGKNSSINHYTDIHLVEQDEKSKDADPNGGLNGYHNATFHEAELDSPEHVYADIESTPPAYEETIHENTKC